MLDSLGDRMKTYEFTFMHKLPPRMPTIIRLDGVCFHTFCKKMQKPFDLAFAAHMASTAIELCKNIATVQLAYTFSDEISLLLHPYKKLNSEGWYDNKLQKIISVSAGIASAYLASISGSSKAIFDSRAFILPEHEVVNYFIWRQQDAERNSLNSMAHSLYSQKELQGKKAVQLHEMIYLKNYNWNALPTYQKRGICIIPRWTLDEHIPIFTQDRNYIERFLEHE